MKNLENSPNLYVFKAFKVQNVQNSVFSFEKQLWSLWQGLGIDVFPCEQAHKRTHVPTFNQYTIYFCTYIRIRIRT